MSNPKQETVSRYSRLPLVAVTVRADGRRVAVDDIPCCLGLLVTYNPWHLDSSDGTMYHDDELDFTGPRNQ